MVQAVFRGEAVRVMPDVQEAYAAARDEHEQPTLDSWMTVNTSMKTIARDERPGSLINM